MNYKPLLRVSPMKNWFRLFLPLALLGALGLVYLGQSRIDENIDRLLFEQSTAVRLGSASLASDLAVAVRHLTSLTHEEPILAALDSAQHTDLDRMTDAFTSLVQRNPTYDQVRWIDETGMERVRLNAIDGKPLLVPEQELQSKANRDYFVDTMRLKPGEIYFSRPDLNVEKGQIEKPKKRMSRVATPVVDSAGKPRGILIINLRMRQLLDHFARNVEFAEANMLLLDQQGTWLHSSDPDDKEGFVMNDKGLTFSALFPAAWARISKQGTGNFLADDGLWVWQRATAQVAGTAVKSQEPLWIVLAHMPAEQIRFIKATIWRELVPAFLIGLAIMATVSWQWVGVGIRQNQIDKLTPGAAVTVMDKRNEWIAYFVALILPPLTVLLRQHLAIELGQRNLFVMFVFPIILSALFGGLLPGLIATGITAFCVNYALLTPILDLSIASPADLFGWLILIANGALISVLSEVLWRARSLSEQSRRQQAELLDQLRDSEARFREIAEHTQDIFWVHEWPDERISYVSPAFQVMTGIPCVDVYRDNLLWNRMIHPEDRESARRGFTEGVRAGQFTLEYRIVRPDGSMRWAEDIGTTIRDAQGQIYRVVGIVRDISARKQAELQRQDSLRLLQTAVHAGNVGLWEWNLQTNKVRFLLGWKTQLGYEDQEITDSFEEWRSRLHPQDLERTMQLVQDCLTIPGQGYQAEYRLRHKDGAYRWIFSQATLVNDDAGKPLYLIGSHVDITERKHTEERLRDSEFHMRLAQDAAQAGSWEWILEGNRNIWSESLWALYGLDPEQDEPSYQTWLAAIHPDDREATSRSVIEAVAKGEEIEIQWRVNLPKVKPERWLMARGRPMVGEDGKIDRYIGIAIDITERKRIEQALGEQERLLAESERRFRQVVETLPQMVWTCQADGSTDYLSPQWVNYTGIPADKQLSFDWQEQIHPDDRKALLEAWLDSTRSGEDFKSEFRIRRFDGAYRWFYALAVPLRNQDGQIEKWFGSNTDVDEFKRTSEALRLINQELDQFFALSTDLLCIADMNGYFLRLGSAWEKFLGYPLQQLENQPYMEYVHPDDRAATLDVVAVLGQGKPVTDFRNRYRTADGDYRWLEWHSVVAENGKIYAVGRDITERQQLDAELALHRQHLEELVTERTHDLEIANQVLEQRSKEITDLYNNAPCGYHSLDADGTIVAINDTELSWLGYQREEVEFRLRFNQLITLESQLVFQENFPRFKETGLLKDLEFDLVRKNGSVLPVIVNATAVRDNDGNFLLSRSTLFDNSERKIRDAEIAELNEELLHRAEQAEAATRAKSAFLANMSHEIRTPMNAVLGFCYLLEQHHLQGEALDLIRKVHSAGRTLLSLINDILDFSKIEAGRLEIETAPFRLPELLDNLGEIMASAAHDKDLELVITPPVDVNALVGDALRLQQVLMNLLSNAVKFTEQGEVELRVDVESSDAREVRLRFAVRDTGIGISREQQTLIFSAFSQADGSISRRFGGIGLGLAISMQLVELMGGSLQVESELGRGSEFWFVLSLQRERCIEHRLPEFTRLELLIADDSASVRESLATVASSLGWIADIADSGEAALMQALARVDGKRRFYDVLLFDWQMPGLDGLEAARSIRDALTERRGSFDAPIVIMVTGYSRDELLAQPGMNWVDQVLSKPITPSALYTAVGNALSRRRQGVFSAAQPQPCATQGTRIPGVRVLVVDDSDINQEVAKRILEADGAVVALAGDGQVAVEWLQAHPDAVDIVLMDVQMPRLDGYAATRRIREDQRWQNLPIVALTAGAFLELREAAQASGMNDFIAKPFNVEQMMGVIQRWTGRRPETVETFPVSASASAVGSNLPDFPGIDLSAALRQWVDLETYHTYLDKFVAEYAGIGEDIAEDCRQGNLQDAAAKAHKLCGAAGSLGVTRVRELAGDMERRLKSGEVEFDLATELQQALDQVGVAVNGWKTADDSSYAPEPHAAVPIDELIPLFKRLLEALDHNDPDDSETRLSQLREQLYHPKLNQIATRLTDFDFKGAKATLQSLLLNLNLSIME